VGIVMKRLTVPALALLAVFVPRADAAAVREDGRNRPDDTPTAAQIAACAPDAQRFCLQHLANRDAMRACMIEHKKQISETCKAAFR
jgi:hypothetical protein